MKYLNKIISKSSKVFFNIKAESKKYIKKAKVLYEKKYEESYKKYLDKLFLNSSKVFLYVKSESKKYIKKAKIIYEKKYGESYKFIKFKFFPYLNRVSDKINNKIVNEEGSEFWVVLSTSQKWSSRIIWTLVGVSGFGIIFATFANIDETIQISGKLEPFGKTIDVKVPLGGVIKDILVNEGDLVEKNQLLLRLDTTAVKANLKALELIKSQISADVVLSKIQLGDEKNISELTENQKIKLESLNKEYLSRVNASKNSVNQIKYQREALIESVKTQEEVLKIRENILDKLKPVIDIGGISKVQYLKEKQEVVQLRGRLASSRAELNKASSALAEVKNRLENTIAATQIDFTTKIEENEKQIAQMEKQISEARVTLNYQEIKSPVDGLVFDLKAEAPGFVVNSNNPILKIVPVDDLVARLFISNKDIAFINENQRVKIRVDAYPYNEFGEIEGIIKSIGSDVLEPDNEFKYYRFPITVELENSYILKKGKKLPLLTGMSVSGNIVLRQRPLIYIFTERLFPFWDSLEQI